MIDIVDRKTRSRMMSGIKGGNTVPEMKVRSFLHASGLRYRLHSRNLPGRPDIILPKHRAVIFVHGCFWHRHSRCRFATTPATNRDFWQQKFSDNVTRDKRVRRELTRLGWRVFIVWECDLGEHNLRALTRAVRGVK